MRTHAPIRLLLPFLVLATASPTSAQAQRRVPDALVTRAATDGRVHVIVQLDVAAQPEGRLLPGARRLQRQRIAAAQQALRVDLRATTSSERRRFRTVPFVALEVGPRALAALERSPRVLAVQEDRLARPTLDLSVPQVQADLTAAAGFDGTGQTVVVLDTGVDAAHPAFAGKIVDEACFALGSPQGSGDCPNGGTEDTAPGSGGFCSYSPDCFHGSHVSGIAVGGGPSFPGVASGAALIPIQVFSEFVGVAECGAPGSCPKSWSSDQVAALEHVFDTLRLQHDVASVNMSLGGAPLTDQLLCDLLNAATKAAIDNLRSVGIATVIAAGNDGVVNAIGQPGCISSAVSVSAVDDFDQIPLFANAASFLSLWAPGVDIRAPLFETTGFIDASGTSMATPHVAGAFAVLRQAEPTLGVDAALAALQATGVPIVDIEAATSRIRVQDAIVALVPECRDGVDGDGDGRSDFPDDPGCASADDDSEQDPALPCDDGADNDGDGAADLADAGCKNLHWIEDPACQDGVDNDGDGLADFDGAGLGEPDPQCVGRPWRKIESRGGGCGLGFELALLVPLLGALSGRLRRGRRRWRDA